MLSFYYDRQNISTLKKETDDVSRRFPFFIVRLYAAFDEVCAVWLAVLELVLDSAGVVEVVLEVSPEVVPDVSPEVVPEVSPELVPDESPDEVPDESLDDDSSSSPTSDTCLPTHTGA